VDPGPARLARCLEHWELLKASTGRLNLISPAALDQGPARHIGDALAALAHWLKPGRHRLLDVGSGGGLPGIPLALAHPGLSVTLLESKEKKTDWLTRAVSDLGLADRISVRNGRLEDQPRAWLGEFQWITARAVAPPDQVLEWVLPVLGTDSRLLVWHSDRQRRSVEAAVARPFDGRMFVCDYTLSYHFASIDHQSCISSLCEAR
jgi:16S rRNA (guanine527-N7)-methyltransferase